MSRYLNPEWQDLREKESAAFKALQKAQSRLTGMLAGRKIPATEDLDQFDASLRAWKEARQEIGAWMAEWLDAQARP